MKTYILVFACDLARNIDGYFVPGTLTRRTCDRAAKLYFSLKEKGEKPVVMPLAGNSPKHGYTWTAGLMAEYLEALGVREIETGRSWYCDTDGEVLEFIEFAKKSVHTETVDVYVVNKWWHMSRTRLLFKLRTPRYLRERLRFHWIPVRSWHVHWIAREFVAFGWNITRTLLFRRNP